MIPAAGETCVGEKPMRVLVLTNHFSLFAGSEVVALQVAQWFARARPHGDHRRQLHGRAAQALRRGHCADQTAVDQIALSDFDLVWCQHDLLSQLPLAAFERASRSRLPHVALVSLSPFEPMSMSTASWRALCPPMSTQTRRKRPTDLLSRNVGAIARPSVRVFHNAAPAEFWRAERPPGATLRSIALISNHPPPELAAALAALQAAGVQTRSIGLHREAKLVAPDDIARPTP